MGTKRLYLIIFITIICYVLKGYSENLTVIYDPVFSRDIHFLQKNWTRTLNGFNSSLNFSFLQQSFSFTQIKDSVVLSFTNTDNLLRESLEQREKDYYGFGTSLKQLVNIEFFV